MDMVLVGIGGVLVMEGAAVIWILWQISKDFWH